jgi:branched-chain amino acid transport system ATP-binding protein
MSNPPPAAGLEVHGLSRRFGGLRALQEVSFRVEPGTILGLIGPNGAGKTTLVNLVTGHDRPTAGRVLVEGRDLTGARPWHFARAGVARSFQVAKPFRDMTVRENVAVGAMYGLDPTASVAAALAGADAVLERVGLAGRAGARPGELAVADARRLELARALATSPRLILLDEVLAGLRPTEVDAACAVLATLPGEGTAVVLVEHVVRAVVAVCDVVLVLHQGRQIAYGPPAQIMEDEAVVEAYLGARYARRRPVREISETEGDGGGPAGGDGA